MALGSACRQLLDQDPNQGVDLVPDPAHCLDVLAGGIFEIPILVALARVDRARIATAHGDDHVRLTHERVGERFRNLPADVEADLTPRLRRFLDDLEQV